MENKHESLGLKALFEPGHTITWDFLSRYDYPWLVLPFIEKIILELVDTLDEAEYDRRYNNIWIHNTAKVAPSAYFGSNVIVGPGSYIRHCAFVRDNVIIGKDATVGNSTEIKNSIIFDNVQIPHFNYVGDTVMGYKSHLGAGAITSNVKSDSSLVSVSFNNEKIETGLKKFGAIVGDRVEIGCNSVLNPGTVIGKDSNIYPLSSVRGYIKPNSIYKSQGEVVSKR